MAPRRCPVCGSTRIVYDEVTGSYICMDCGYVVEEEVMVPGPKDYERTAPLEHGVKLSVPRELAEKIAREEVERTGAPTWLVERLAGIMTRGEFRAPIRLVKSLVDGTDSEREARVKMEIEMYATKCGVDPETVWSLAEKYLTILY